MQKSAKAYWNLFYNVTSFTASYFSIIYSVCTQCEDLSGDD